MTTFEEDMVDVYYNLRGYFTMKNIPFSAIEKRPGGKGRGEIDILAIRVTDDKIKDIVHAEVGVSVTSPFPFVSTARPGIDECNKMLRKFFRNDSEHKIREIFGGSNFRRVIVSSTFSKNAVDKLKKRIVDFGAEIKKVEEKEGEIFITIEDSGKTLEIEILPFNKIMKTLKKTFKESGLEMKNFQDPRYRMIQYMVNNGKVDENAEDIIPSEEFI